MASRKITPQEIADQAALEKLLAMQQAQQAALQSTNETTPLAPVDESKFQAWAQANHIHDVDHPDSHYDYRGYWNQYGNEPHQRGTHFTDEFKQHGHPTFSNESGYSKNFADGGYWNYDTNPEGVYVSAGAGPGVVQPDQAALDQAYLQQKLFRR